MDPFATLGLPRSYELDVALLEARYRDLQRALHPDRHTGAGASQRRMSLAKAVEVNDAYRILKDDLKRAQALLAQYREGNPATTPPAESEFLMEVMELRETLGEAKQARDLVRVRSLAASVERLQMQTRQRLVEGFAALSAAPDVNQLDAIASLIGRLQYYRRFLDEVSVIEEESLS